jgi:DNA helicase II / ATP-dependent DNA helicase PcrA
MTTLNPTTPHEKKYQEEVARLNAQQKRAVEHIEGPVMVIAGPGTGKTQIIAARIGNILRSDAQVAPHNILCLTYTDAGTVAMRNRLQQFIGPTAFRVNIHTFHAFCNTVIQNNMDSFEKKEMSPLTDLENIELLRSLIDDLPNTHLLKRFKGEVYTDIKRFTNLFRTMKEENWSAQYMADQIAIYLNDLPNRDEYRYKKANSKTGIKVGDLKTKDIEAEKEKMEVLRAAAYLFPDYVARMKAMGRYDYSDMILWVLQAFKTNENLLRHYQEWFQYFLVDEYQDTSGAQNELLQLLIGYWDKPNAFVVGDDDQCIYEFQGARLKNMTQFFDTYEKDIEVIVLKENYRSTQHILDAAKTVIDNNQQRLTNQPAVVQKIKGLSKTLISKSSAENILPTLTAYPNHSHEDATMVEELIRLQEAGVNLSEVAIIYAQNKQAENIIHWLEKKEIPYHVKKKINILSLPLVQQLISILRYLQQEHTKPHSGEYLLFQIMHYSYFGIPPRDIAKISLHCATHKLRWRNFLSEQEELQKLKLSHYAAILSLEENLSRWIQDVANTTLQTLFERVLNQSGLLKHILSSADKIVNLQVVTTFFDFIKEESSKRTSFSIAELLHLLDLMLKETISLDIHKTVFQENGVTLITAHSVKGREYEHVYLMGCNKKFWEGKRGGNYNYQLPDTLVKQDDPESIESNRRLFYVALTRAKKYLHISFSENDRSNKALEHTQFISELTSALPIAIEKKVVPTEKLMEYSAVALTEKLPASIRANALIEKETIKNKLEHFSMSSTQLNDYINCPISFYYKHILRVPQAKNVYAALGTATHNALKWLFNQLKENHNKFPSADKLVTEFKRQLSFQKDAFTEQEFINQNAYGELTLPDYYNQYIETWNKNVVTEHGIKEVEVEGVPINGNIDKIEFNGEQVNVVDYKTGDPSKAMHKLKAPDEKEPNGGDYWRQLVFYKLLLDNYKRQNWKAHTGEIDFIQKDKYTKKFIKKQISISTADVSMVKEQLKSSYQKIMNHEFTQGCGKEECEWCAFAQKIV